jgi:hypothetical protein
MTSPGSQPTRCYHSRSLVIIQGRFASNIPALVNDKAWRLENKEPYLTLTALAAVIEAMTGVVSDYTLWWASHASVPLATTSITLCARPAKLLDVQLCPASAAGNDA